jgi:hypothetical protein
MIIELANLTGEERVSVGNLTETNRWGYWLKRKHGRVCSHTSLIIVIKTTLIFTIRA